MLKDKAESGYTIYIANKNESKDTNANKPGNTYRLGPHIIYRGEYPLMRGKRRMTAISRARTGCWTCRARRIKCDGNFPLNSCSNTVLKTY